ncbi:MAG: SAF domain-containing protein, partial [Actinomycetota bacterium]|nr:SAF domain-containing protein [Actinomycetota bacterium]
MNPLARLRHVLARRPWLYWLAVITVAAAGGLVAARAVAAVEDERAAWGSPRTVVVARRDVAPGEVLDEATERRTVPAPVVPPDALTTTREGAMARQRIAAGEIVVEHD